MSADGQDPPDLLQEMMDAHLQEKFEVVVCERTGRDESWFRILTSKLFYWLMRKLCFKNMPIGGFSFVLLGRRVLDVVLRNEEAHPFFQGQILWSGYPVKFIKYFRPDRYAGRSRWTFARKITLLIDGVLGYSFFPIRLMSLVGILAAMGGYGYGCVAGISPNCLWILCSGLDHANSRYSHYRWTPNADARHHWGVCLAHTGSGTRPGEICDRSSI